MDQELIVFIVSFDRGEDGVSGVLLHHKQVIKPYYLNMTIGLQISLKTKRKECHALLIV